MKPNMWRELARLHFYKIWSFIIGNDRWEAVRIIIVYSFGGCIVTDSRCCLSASSAIGSDSLKTISHRFDIWASDALSPAYCASAWRFVDGWLCDPMIQLITRCVTSRSHFLLLKWYDSQQLSNIEFLLFLRYRVFVMQSPTFMW